MVEKIPGLFHNMPLIFRKCHGSGCIPGPALPLVSSIVITIISLHIYHTCSSEEEPMAKRMTNKASLFRLPFFSNLSKLTEEAEVKGEKNSAAISLPATAATTTNLVTRKRGNAAPCKSTPQLTHLGTPAELLAHNSSPELASCGLLAQFSTAARGDYVTGSGEFQVKPALVTIYQQALP